MNELERHLRATIRTDSAVVEDVRAPRAVKRAIARRRGLTAGAIGAAAAVAIGSVAVGGLGLSDTTDPPGPDPTPDLSIDEGARAYATVPLPEHSHMYGQVEYHGARWCGQAPPEPHHSDGDFTATFDLPAYLDLGRDVHTLPEEPASASISLTYGSTDELPAFGGGLTALLIEDGIVVGFEEDYRQPIVTTFKADQTKTYLWRWTGWINGCGTDADALPPPPGEYEVVFVSPVHNDRTSAAQWSLHLDNYVLPAAADLEAYREGSYRCGQWQMWGGGEPLTCNPNAVVGFELDEEAETATIPYDTSYYLRDVDIAFASAPVPATVHGENPEHFFLSDNYGYEPGTEIMCGDVYGWLGNNEAQLVATWPPLTTLPEPGAGIGAALWLQSLGWETAHVTPPQNPRIWLTRSKQVHEETVQGDTTYGTTFQGNEVVGWVDTESATAQPVEIHVYDGPRDWHLSATDAQWCDGQDASNFDSPLAQPGFTGLIAEPAAVTLNDGSSYEGIALALNLDHFN